MLRSTLPARQGSWGPSVCHGHQQSRCLAAPALVVHTRHASTGGRSRGRPLAVSVRALFTGIVQGTARVVSVERSPQFARVAVQLPPGKAAAAQVGASVAINGTCLTVTGYGADNPDVLNFDIMMETLRATNLGGLEPGSVVNFERSARVGDEIGGHTVSGHVHTTAAISGVDLVNENNRRICFRLADPRFIKYVLPKGFISVDGCSLTVGEVWGGDSFSVYLIPETLRVTVFGVKGVGDSVNIEVEAQTQAIVDTVERVVAQYMAAGAAAGAGTVATAAAAAAAAASSAATPPPPASQGWKAW